ncbi:OapC/ArvC family zinc-ribbon domain-containing protein [Haloarchaeobius sp. DYHT-AS-18]|uniref:Zn-ribbon domain-containing protein n=1 Tax=Haloarchaeobius sp. DYHT-AS-18 TaxID=3446117 RepID=UPI003EB7921A
MPHQCTECGRTFEDGSKEMLSGCPECDGNKFQFIPKGAVNDATASASPPEPPARGSESSAVSKAATTVRDWVNRNSQDEDKAWPKSATENYDTPAEKAAARADDSAAPANDSAPTETAGSTRTGGSSGTGDQSATATPDSPVDSAPQETPASTAGDTGSPGAAQPDPPSAGEPEARSAADAEGLDAGEVGPAPSPEDQEATGGISARTMSTEDNAQASARSDVVSPDELPDPSERSPPATSGDSTRRAAQATERSQQPQPTDGHVVAEPSDTEVDDRPDLDELREELNQQFESIKILNPGQYELNLMELYDREEYIISLREDGRYVIDVPDSWRGSE